MHHWSEVVPRLCAAEQLAVPEQLTFGFGPLGARIASAARTHRSAEADLAAVLIEARQASWSWADIGRAADGGHSPNWHRIAQWAGRTVAWAGRDPRELYPKGTR